ncbi:MAG: hypothetical protein JWO33_1035, partial [Caulobacteraceae bacterium]|nr:hypothetical protein [Caulobacteraceae bacterium]
SGPGALYAACFLSFTVAGAPSWHLWTQVGVLGVAAATMFLCGMLAQLVASSLAAKRLFIVSAAPLVCYLVLTPAVAFGPQHPAEGLGIVACALLMIVYLAVLWRGQQRVLESVQASREQAEAASRAKTEFLATMSHEIRTPMNAVLGAADLLDRTELSAEQRAHVTMLQDGGAILMQVLNDVLDLSKIEAGKLSIARSTVDLHSLVRRCANFWAPRVADAGLEMRVEIAPGTPRHVSLDAIRTGQILFNLIANAIKFTADGTITLGAMVREDAAGDTEVVISVRDTGMGIGREALSRLFRPFEQADGSITRRFGGTGLGLAIGQRLAGLMAGEITAQSAEGMGSVFYLRIPAQVLEVEAAEPVDPEQAPQDLSAPLRVLVAEDNPANQRIIEHFLRPIGAVVTMVGDGAQAVEMLAMATFDVVLMDMQMPVMDGLEATRRVRAGGGPNAEAPIFALTANVMEAHRDACVAAGMSGHIAKPIDARLLLSSVLNAGMIAAAQRLDSERREVA